MSSPLGSVGQGYDPTDPFMDSNNLKGVLSTKFFTKEPLPIGNFQSSKQSDPTYAEIAQPGLREFSDSEYAKDLEHRIVGLVLESDLKKVKTNSSYQLKRTLIDRFPYQTHFRHLLDGCEKQLILPEATGIAITEDIILTAGHSCENSKNSMKVVQYKLQNSALPFDCVYEISSIVKHDFSNDNTPDVDIYTNNLLEGEWGIIRLTKPLKGVKGLYPLFATKIQEFQHNVRTFTVGHPFGAPLKISHGRIEATLENNIVRYNVQTLRGMSGGPVFNAETKCLLGIHIRGNLVHNTDLHGIRFDLMTHKNPEFTEALTKKGVYGSFFQRIEPIIKFLEETVLKKSLLEHCSAPSNPIPTIYLPKPTLPNPIPAVAHSGPRPFWSTPLNPVPPVITPLKPTMPVATKKVEYMEEKKVEKKENKNGPLTGFSSMTFAPPLSQATIIPPTNPTLPITNVVSFDSTKWSVLASVTCAPLPNNIHEILSAKSKYWPEKMVGETDRLVYIPPKLDHDKYCYATLRDRIKKAKKIDCDLKMIDSGQEFLKDVEPGWILATKDILPGTFEIPRVEQLKVLAKDSTYRLPKGLEAATIFLTEFVEKGEPPVSVGVRRYVRCEETIDGNQVIFGSFDKIKGPIITKTGPMSESLGLCLGVIAVKRL